MEITRALAGPTIACALLATPIATPALAHVHLAPQEAPAGATLKVVLAVPHGCEGAATTGITVTIPEGFAMVKPMPKPGWTLATDTGETGVTAVTWQGGNLPDAHFDEFTLRGRVGDLAPGTVLAFPVAQTCTEGATDWNETAAPGDDPHALAHPAPLLKVAAGPPDHASGHGDAHAAAPIAIAAAWIRQPPPGAAVAGAYLTIENSGSEPDRLLGGSTPFAARFEVHEMKTKNGMMQMQEVEGGVPVPAGATVELAPGGYHIMLMDLSEAPVAGARVPMSLTFEKAGTIEVMADVAPMGATSAPAAHGEHGTHGAN